MPCNRCWVGSSSIRSGYDRTRRSRLRQVLPPQYQKWLDEDARYIIADQERSEFAKFTNDQQRDEFVERFWEKRNPEPGSSPNVYKEQHYERIRFANSHFSALGTSGWKTDRGRIYIVFGPPDQHRSALFSSGIA